VPEALKYKTTLSLSSFFSQNLQRAAEEGIVVLLSE